MLQSIRDRLVGWVAWGIVILIGVPFAIMGVTDFGSPARTAAVAEIDDMIIEQRDYQRRYQSRRQNIQRQLGASYRPDVFDAQIRQQVIDTMIEEKLLSKLAEDHNMQVGDKELSAAIQVDPSFQQDGKFSFDYYKARIGQLGFTTASYEDFLRSEQVLSTVPRIIRASSFSTQNEIIRFHQLSGQRRKIEYMMIGRDYFPEDIVISDEVARTYYDKHRAEFLRPDQVKLEYVRLSATELSGRVETTEEAVRQFYDENADRYMVDEQRKASHILLSLPDGQSLEDNPEVVAKLSDIQARLNSGEDFEVLAKEYSDDPGSARDGGKLGQVLRGMMVPPFENALFSMRNVGEISMPIQTSFGVHLIRLDGITEKKVKAFEDVQEELKEGFAERQAVELFYDISERMAELSYENPDSLLPVAEALELSLQTTDWVSRGNDNLGIESNQDVLKEAFSERLRNGTANSDPVEVGANDALILRVTDFREASQIPFEDIQEQARKLAEKDARDKKIADFANELVTRLQGGDAVEAVAEAEKLELLKPDAIDRGGSAVPAALSRAVFSMQAPQNGKFVVKSFALEDGEQAITILREIILPEDGDKDRFAKQLNSRDAARDAQNVLASMREKAKVIIHKDKL